MSGKRIKELRDELGIGISNIQQAFFEADGDEELAIKYLKGDWRPPSRKALENRIAKLEKDIQYLIGLIARESKMLVQYYKDNRYVGFDKQYEINEISWIITTLKPGMSITIWFV